MVLLSFSYGFLPGMSGKLWFFSSGKIYSGRTGKQSRQKNRSPSRIKTEIYQHLLSCGKRYGQDFFLPIFTEEMMA